MQVGPCILRWKHRYKRMKPAQLLGQLGVFLTCACCWNNASVAELPGSSALRFLQSCIASWLCNSFFRNSSRRSSAVYEGALSFVTAMRYPIGILHANENWRRVLTEDPRLKTGSPAAAALLGRSTASLASAPPSPRSAVAHRKQWSRALAKQTGARRERGGGRARGGAARRSCRACSTSGRRSSSTGAARARKVLGFL
jgi:hypothetical protein